MTQVWERFADGSRRAIYTCRSHEAALLVLAKYRNQGRNVYLGSTEGY